eukprot:m.268620 g.268620  ORF g.268620 m.268620 type:complete len:421 (+) comp79660_c0_seq1:182-1444(+)
MSDGEDDDFGGFDDDDVDDANQDEFGTEEFDDFGSGFAALNTDQDDFGGFGSEDFEEFKSPSAPIKEEEDEEGFDDDDGFGESEKEAQPKAPPLSKKIPLEQRTPIAPKQTKPTQHIALRMANGSKPQAKQKVRGVGTTLSKSLAVNLNKNISRASQPFTCGFDMTTNEQMTSEGLCLRRIFLNCMMVAPGSFSVEIRTEANGGGECLAKEVNISANANFNQTVIDFSDQPILNLKEIYHYHLILECGAFKFQGTSATTKALNVHRYHAFKRKEKAWVATATSYVTKPVFRKAIPKRGDRCGYMLVKTEQKQNKKKRMSLRRVGKPGMRRFLVLEAQTLRMFADVDGVLEDVLNLADVDYVENKGGEINTKDFNVITKSKEYQFAATSTSECSKWVKSIEKARAGVEREYGAAASTSMLF